MKEIVKEFLLVGDKFILKLHLGQPGFMYSTYGLFTNNKESTEIQKFRETVVDP